jgi:hypothetical protein
MRATWRRSGEVVGLVASISIVLHLVLLAQWRWSILPDLERAPHAVDAAVRVFGPFPDAPRSWSLVELCGIKLKAPTPRRGDSSVTWPHDRNPGMCTVSLDVGWLHAYSSPLDENFWVSMAVVAPHSSDIGLWNLPWRNWRMMVAVARRAQIGTGGGLARRFNTPTASGAIISFDNREVERHVIYAFGEGRCGGRLITVTRASESTLRRVIGSLDPRPGPVRPDIAEPQTTEDW